MLIDQFMRGSRNFRQGGGGGPGQSHKKALTFFFFCFLFSFFFLVLSLFYRSRMVNFKEKLSFSRGGGGGPTFSRGVHLLIPYRNPYNL